MKKITKAVMAGMVMAGVLCGCSSGSDTKNSQSSVTSIQKEEKIVLGDQNSENKKITLKNETGKTIVSFTLAPAELSSIPENMLKNNVVWKEGKEADLYLDSQQAQSESLLLTVKLADSTLSGTQTSRSEMENSLADSQSSSQSEEEYSLYSFPVSRIGSEAVLTIEDGQLVLSWKEGEETLSTRTDAQDNPETSPEEEPQPEEETQEPEEPVQEEQPEVQDPAASDQPIFQEPVYEEPVYFAPDGSELDDQNQQGSLQEGSSIPSSSEAGFEAAE